MTAQNLFKVVRPALFWSLVVSLLLGVTVLAGALEPAGPDEELTIWAASLPEDAYHPGAYAAGIYTDPTKALGVADELEGGVRVVSLGNALEDVSEPPLLPTQCEAYLLLAFDQSFTDGPGIDLVIFEAAAGGVEEATWVYVGRDNDLWLYVGEAGDDFEGGGVDMAGAVQPGDLFNHVAVCDRPDGITSGSPVGGPDIDAIAALHPVILPDYRVRATSPGVTVNGNTLPDGAVSEPIEPGDTIDLTAGASAEIVCDDNLLPSLVLGATLQAISGRLQGDGNIVANAIEKHPDCKAPGRAAVATSVELTLQDGGMIVSEPPTTFIVQLLTPLAIVTNDDAAFYKLSHWSDTNETAVTAFGQQLVVTPVDPAPTPFPLGPAQRVTIDSDGIGPITNLDQTALPVVVAPGE